MKKSFIAVLAIMGMVACNNEEYISTPSADQMTFGVADVENATRAADPSTTTATLSAFDVWAFMDQPSGTVLVDEDVTKSGSKWGYSNVQYWTPKHTYYFAALAPMNSANWDLDTANANTYGAGVVEFTNVDGSEDLLYAATSVNTDAMKIGDEMPAVKFAFSHLLSKINFTFKNGFTTDNVTVIVENVQMTAPSAGTIDLAVENWWDNDDWQLDGNTTTLSFGDVKALSMGTSATPDYERLTIPADANQTYTITFDVTVKMGDVVAIDALPFTSELSGAAFEMGKAYNMNATINPENLNLKEIVFDVQEVKEWVNQTINGGAIGEKWEVVSTIADLQAALDAATGNTSISLGANLTGNVTVPELNGATISINGNGYTFDGTFALVGGSTYGKGTTIFENINFATTALNGYDAFIYCNEQNGNTRYPDNVIIKDCTFTGANDLPVGAKFRSLNGNLVITNSSAKDMHSLVQLTSCGKANVTIDGAVVENCKNGIGLGLTASATIKNSTIKAREYGVRADGGATTTDIIKSTIDAKQPVIVRKATAAGYVLNVDDATVLNNAGLYQVIFTAKSDDEEYVVPTVDFTFNGPADLLVYPNVIIVDNAADLAATLTSNRENINVVLTNDIDVAITDLGQITAGSGEYKLGGVDTKSITIDLNTNKLNITTTYWSAIGAKNDNALFTIKNGTMTSTGNSAGTWNAYNVRLSNCNYVIEDVVFEKPVALDNVGKSTVMKNVTINEATDKYALWITAEGQEVTIDGLNIKAGRGIKIDEQYVTTAEKVTLNISNATFETSNKSAIIVKSVAGAEINAANLDITAVAADNTYAVWVDEATAEYADKVVVTGALMTVEATEVSTVAQLTEALESKPIIEISNDIDNGSNKFMITGNDVVINGDGTSTITAGGQSSKNYAFQTDGSNVVVNDVNINGAGFAAINGSNVTVNNSTIEAVHANSGRNMFYVDGNSEVTVNEGTYTFSRTSCYFVYVGAGSTCYIKGGTFEKPLANSASKDVFVNSASQGTVIITGGTFNVDPTQWVPAGYKAEKSGKWWTVSAE